MSYKTTETGNSMMYYKGNLGSILELGRSPGEGKGYSLQYSDLENRKEDHKESDTAEQLSLSPTNTDIQV